MRAGHLALIFWAALVAVAAAEGVERSPVPPANPRYGMVVPEVAPEVVPEVALAVVPEDALVRSLRPMPRPAALVAKVAAVRAAAVDPGLDLTPPVAEDLAEVPPPARKEKRRKKREAASMAGAVCGMPAIKGEVLVPITSKVTGCGVEEPVRISAVSGVRLSQRATVDCATAKALNTWVTWRQLPPT